MPIHITSQKTAIKTCHKNIYIILKGTQNIIVIVNLKTNEHYNIINKITDVIKFYTAVTGNVSIFQ